MPYMGWLDEGLQHPPPGRVRLSLQEAEQSLVLHPLFDASTSRPSIWSGLIDYLGEFVRLEDRWVDILEGRSLIEFLWLGGSFVSAKVDPRNLDVCVAVDATAQELLYKRAGSAWLTRAFYRDGALKRYRLSPLALPYRAIVSPFQSHQLERPDIDYLRERGTWDDWFQRLRDPEVSDGVPRLSTVPARRGYVEVVL